MLHPIINVDSDILTKVMDGRRVRECHGVERFENNVYKNAEDNGFVLLRFISAVHTCLQVKHKWSISTGSQQNESEHELVHSNFFMHL